MSNKKIMKYVEKVMSKITAPEELKDRLEDELSEYLFKASEGTSFDEVIDQLGSPEELSEEISRRLVIEMSKDLDRIFTKNDKKNVNLAKIDEKDYEKPDPRRHHDRHKPRQFGEFTREDSKVNIKLLYIPLIQITSGVQRISFHWMDDDDYYYD